LTDIKSPTSAALIQWVDVSPFSNPNSVNYVNSVFPLSPDNRISNFSLFGLLPLSAVSTIILYHILGYGSVLD
jgi:hypothetical protein